MAIDPLGFVTEDLKQQLTDGILGRLAKWTERVPKAKQAFLSLRSDREIQSAIDQGIVRATKRFVDEYTAIDEDLVSAMQKDQAFWESPTVRTALLEIVQNPVGYIEEEQAIIAQSFSDILPERINRERVDKAVSHYLRCVAEALWHLEPFRPIYELQMQRLNAETASTMVQGMLGMQSDFRQAVLALIDTVGQQQRQLADSATTNSTTKPLVLHNLPQRNYGRFVGREAELDMVRKLLRPYPHSQHSLISIDGIGGIGKSTLALEVAHRYLNDFELLPPEERFDTIIWTSAKDSVLTADGIQRRHQTHKALDDIYNAIAITIQREDISRTDHERQTELVRSAIAQRRTLLIVDNLETIDDETVLAFLRDIPAPGKAIITTRHRIDVAYPVRLKGMEWSDAVDLIQEMSDSREVVLSEQEALRLYERTGGVPLALKWSIGLIAAGYPPETVLYKLGEPSSDIIRFCFEQSLSAITGTSAEKLLIALSYFVTSASRTALGTISQLSTLDRDDGLVVLEKLSLVNKQSDRFYLLPITRVFAVNQSKHDMDVYLDYGRRWMEYLQSLHSSVEEYAAEFRLKFGIYLAPEDGPNLLEAVEWAYEYGNAYDVFSMTVIAESYLDITGRWATMMEYQERAIDLAITIRNHRALARLLHSAGWLHEQRGEFDQARQQYEEGIQFYEEDGNVESLVIILQRLSAIYRKQGDLQNARKMLDDAWGYAAKLDSGDINALLSTEEGKHQRDLENWDAAWEHFTIVREYFEKRIEQSPRDEQLATGTYGHLAIVAYHQGRYLEAKELAQRSIDFFAKYGTKGYLATLKYRLALAEEALGDVDAAKMHVGEAIYWFRTLGMAPDLPKAEALWERLERQ